MTEAVYTATASWPRTEMFGLTRHFLSIAHGSVREVETCVLLGLRLGYLAAPESERLLDHTSQVGRLVTGLANALPQKGKR